MLISSEIKIPKDRIREYETLTEERYKNLVNEKPEVGVGNFEYPAGTVINLKHSSCIRMIVYSGEMLGVNDDVFEPRVYIWDLDEKYYDDPVIPDDIIFTATKDSKILFIYRILAFNDNNTQEKSRFLVSHDLENIIENKKVIDV